MKIFISGATGGLGLELCRNFTANNHQVTGVGRNIAAGEALIKMGCNFIAADLRDFEFAGMLSGFDIVVHAAARSSAWGDYNDFYHDNVLITQKIYNEAVKSGVNGFVNISSPSIYAAPYDQIGVTEQTPISGNFLNHYAKTKFLAEEFLLNQNDNDIKVTSIRPRALIGYDDNVLLPRFLRLIKRGKFPLFNHGNSLLEPTDVRDAASFIRLCAEKIDMINGEVFNISGGKAMNVRAMVELISKAIGRDVRFIDINYNFAALFVKALEGICNIIPTKPEPPLTYYSLSTLSFSQTFDLTKAYDLGFVPQYDVFETMGEIANSMRGQFLGWR